MQQFQAFLATQIQQNHNPYHSGDDAHRVDHFREVPRSRRSPVRYEDERRQDDKRLWKVCMCTEVLEYHGSLQPKEFIDQLYAPEKVLEFKGMPEDMKVRLIAIKLRGRATA